ncbi:MAG TPA: tetratricopeptide repeat protein [Thermoanaerobaculia bacterium]
MRTKTILLLTALGLLAACTAAPPPAVIPQGDDRFLIDPRIGYRETVSKSLNDRFETAWRYVLAGNEAEAARRLADIRRREPSYQPALLGEVALDLRADRTSEARRRLTTIGRPEGYTAAAVYTAELVAREGRSREALEIYRTVEAEGALPAVLATRMSQLTTTVSGELFAAGLAAEGSESIRLLREALTFRPEAVEIRTALAQRLVAQKRFDDARREIDPLLNTAAELSEVQEILAEVSAGKGQYQDAIARYERLVRTSSEPRHAVRLEEIKRKWISENMPPHYNAAVESAELTRAQLATLLYWSVPAVRFAQNLPSPPIATDIGDVEGREEIIRAIGIGLYEVDPVTRRVSPWRPVTAGRLSTHLARVLLLRGAPCARGATQESALAACGVANPLSDHPSDAIVTGRTALRSLEQVAKAFR